MTDQDNLPCIVGRLEREEMRLKTYKVGTAEYNQSYKKIMMYKEDIISRCRKIYSPYNRKEENPE